MRELNVDVITNTVENLCIESNYFLPRDVKKALEDAVLKEESPVGRETLLDVLDLTTVLFHQHFVFGGAEWAQEDIRIMAFQLEGE